MTTHSTLVHDLWQVIRSVCVFIAFCALAANFVPRAALIRNRRRRACYKLLVEVIAGCGLNLRICLPSLDMQWMGFRAKRRFRQGSRDDATGETRRV